MLIIKRSRFLLTTVFVVSMSSPILATTIVAIRTPELFAVAADSAGTFKGGGKPNIERPVSKIFQTGGVLYAVAGLVKDPPRGFDVEALVASSAKASQLQSAVRHLEAILSDALIEELLKLQNEEPLIFEYETKDPQRGTSVLLASFENGQPIAIEMQFQGAVESDGSIVVRWTRFACPGHCPNDTHTFIIGHRKAIDKYFEEHRQSAQMSPEEAVKFMVQLEIDAGTPGVAPPIAVVRLNKDGITWLPGQEAGKQSDPKH